MAHEKNVVGYELGTRLGEGLVARVYSARKTTVEDLSMPGSDAAGNESQIDSQWAVKVARSDAKGAVEALQRESKVLERLRGISRVAQLIECGSGYLVMPVYGANAADVRRKRRKGGLECEEVVAMGRGMLRCLKDLHGSGWIHRDVKPANFVFRNRSNDQSFRGCGKRKRTTKLDTASKETETELGRATNIPHEEKTTSSQEKNKACQTSTMPEDLGNGCSGRDGAEDVVLLDMGLAKRYAHSNGKHIAPRASVGFRGTPAYASPRAHDGEDLSRRDDLISLFFTLVELVEGKLPWRGLEEDAVGQTKKYYLASKLHELTPKSGKLLHPFLQEVEAMNFKCAPDYDLLEKRLLQGLRDAPESKNDEGRIWDKDSGHRAAGTTTLERIDQILDEIAEVAGLAQSGCAEAAEFLQQLVPAYESFKSKVGRTCSGPKIGTGFDQLAGTSSQRKSFEQPGFVETPKSFQMPPKSPG
eukprot:scaffold752_cov322-Pavlova_lutheri.AAC.41